MRRDHIATAPRIGRGEKSPDLIASPFRRSRGSAGSDLISYL